MRDSFAEKDYNICIKKCVSNSYCSKIKWNNNTCNLIENGNNKIECNKNKSIICTDLISKFLLKVFS